MDISVTVSLLCVFVINIISVQLIYSFVKCTF